MTTQATHVNGHNGHAGFRALPELGPVNGWPKAQPSAAPARRARRTGNAAIAALMAVLASGLAVYSAAASYESVSRLAHRLNIPLSQLTPLGIDGGMFGVIAFDIALTLTGRPIWWLRWTGRLFASGVIAANAAAGWPDPVSVGLRCGAPLLFVVIVEAARAVMLGRTGSVSRDRIPRMRWLLDARGTWSLWRRMRLWGERSFAAAVDTELARIDAIERLRAHYGSEAWEASAPRDLAWMLRSGVRIGEALGRVSELLACAERDAAVQSRWDAERAVLAAECETARTAARSADEAAADAERRLGQAGEEIARLTRKRAAETAKRAGRSAPGKGTERNRAAGLNAAEARRAAREIYDADPGISAEDLAARFGFTERWGFSRLSEFKAANATPGGV